MRPVNSSGSVDKRQCSRSVETLTVNRVTRVVYTGLYVISLIVSGHWLLRLHDQMLSLR